MNRPFLFGQKYKENMLDRDAFRFLVLPAAKIQIVLKKFFYVDILKAKFWTLPFSLWAKGKYIVL